MDSISKANVEERTYARLFFLEDRLVGAVAIGELRNRKDLLIAIKTKEHFPDASARQALLDAC